MEREQITDIVERVLTRVRTGDVPAPREGGAPASTSQMMFSGVRMRSSKAPASARGAGPVTLLAPGGPRLRRRAGASVRSDADRDLYGRVGRRDDVFGDGDDQRH